MIEHRQQLRMLLAKVGTVDWTDTAQVREYHRLYSRLPRSKDVASKWYQKNKKQLCEKRRKYYYAHKKQTLARDILNRFKNPAKYLLKSAYARAKKFDYAFTIVEQDIRNVWPSNNLCPVFNVPMILKTKYAPSLDRLDNQKGYIPGNIGVLSKYANRMKSTATVAQLKALVAYVERGLQCSS